MSAPGWTWDGPALVVLTAVGVLFALATALVRTARRQLGRAYRRWRYGNAATVGEE